MKLLQLLSALSNCSAYKDKGFIKVTRGVIEAYGKYLTNEHGAQLQDDSFLYFGKKKLLPV